MPGAAGRSVVVVDGRKLDATTVARLQSDDDQGIDEQHVCSNCRSPLGLWYRSRGKITRLRADDVVAVQSNHKYADVYTRDGRVHITEFSTVKLERAFGRAFVRVHRNAIIRVSDIEEFKSDLISEYLSMNSLTVTVAGLKFEVSRRRWGMMLKAYKATMLAATRKTEPDASLQFEMKEPASRAKPLSLTSEMSPEQRKWHKWISRGASRADLERMIREV